MDLYDFYNTFISAVAADETLDAWCVLHFGQGVTVLPDFDANSPPGSDARPYVLFHTPGFERDQEQRTARYYLGATLVIDIGAAAVRVEDNVTQVSGMELICDYMTHVQRIVAAALPANFSLGTSAAADTMATDTEVVAEMDMAFSQKHTIGSDPLA